MSTKTERRWIPEMARDEIVQRASRIHPLIRHHGVLWTIKSCDLFEVAFTWDPKFHKKVPTLAPVCTIITRHSWAYYGLFKPSIAEVLPFIPSELLPVTFGFEVVGPDTASDLNFSRHKEAFDASFHTAETTLYRLA